MWCCGQSATPSAVSRPPRSTSATRTWLLGKRARSVLRAFARDARRALADPGTEQGKDIWDLAIFGHPGTLSFARITQPWLSAAAKRWAAEQPPRHRGSGAARVQAKINNPSLLSQHLNGRPDHGSDPAALSRGDVEAFLNRVAYLEADGQISRYRRNMICRDVRAVLAGIRIASDATFRRLRGRALPAAQRAALRRPRSGFGPSGMRDLRCHRLAA